MYLRIAGAIIGGTVSLLAIIIVSPNFDTLPTMLRPSRFSIRLHTLRSAMRGCRTGLLAGRAAKRKRKEIDPSWAHFVPIYRSKAAVGGHFRLKHPEFARIFWR
jgi:hypothetical protein